MTYTLGDLLAAEEAWREASRDWDGGSDRHNNSGRVRREMLRHREEVDRKHSPLVDAIRADLAARGDPDYFAHVAAQRDAREKEEAARAERIRIQETLHALYPEPKRGARYEFEGRVYVRRASQFPGGRPTYFKEVPRDPSKGEP
jgi:hypothetical protein